MSESLHTCPDCGQPNFTASGLKTHQGGKTCKARAAAKSSDVVTLIEGYDAAAEEAYGLSKPKASLEGEAAACVSRFRAFHEAAKGSVMALKLAKFFAGIEVQTLCDLHEEMYGETRGGGKTDRGVSVLLGPYLEEHLGVTDRTARRYKNHFLSCTLEKPELAEKLRKWWLKWKDDAALQLTASDAQTNKGKGKAGETQLVTAAPSALALHEVCNLAAKDVQELLDHADAWGLSELFEKPIKDVTPPKPADTTEDDGRDDAKERLAKFWLQDFCRRALNNEFLKLRKQDKEALLTTFEEAVTKLKSSLEPKGGKKA
jgi:hypothetical protein